MQAAPAGPSDCETRPDMLTAHPSLGRGLRTRVGGGVGSPDTTRASEVAAIRSRTRGQANAPPIRSTPCPAACRPQASPASPAARPTGPARQEVESKVAEYLAAGVELVWVLDGATAAIIAYSAGQAPHTFAATDALTAPFLPGFAVPVAEFFA